MSIMRKYRKSLDQQWLLRLKTRHPDGDNYDGVITQIKSRFIVLREEENFEFNGVIVLPKRFIKGVRDGKYEVCCNEILRENGSIRKCGSPSWLDDCETIADVIAALKKRDIWPGVETIFNDMTDTAFYIGPITKTSNEHFCLRCYDAAGEWEKEYKLKYEDVFRIELGSKYCKYFNAHMRRRVGA
jgi:hypothetical protein